MTTGPVSPVPREARAYQGRRAGLVTQSLAAAIDGVVVLVLLLLGYAGWSLLLFLVNPVGFTFPDLNLVLSLAAGLVVMVVYLTLSWRFGGRSYGCLVMGLRVVSFRGRHMTFVGALLRAVLCVVFPLGIVWVALSRENRSLQDTLLRTSVVYDWLPAAAQAGRARRP